MAFGDQVKEAFEKSEVVQKIKERVDTIFSEFDYLKSSVDELKEWDSVGEILTNMVKITDFVTHVVVAVELSANELIDSVEGLTIQNSAKLDAAVEILDNMIKLPVYLEILDGPAIRILLSQSVTYLNKYLGHTWNLDFAREAFSQGVDYISYVQKKFLELLK